MYEIANATDVHTSVSVKVKDVAKRQTVSMSSSSLRHYTNHTALGFSHSVVIGTTKVTRTRRKNTRDATSEAVLYSSGTNDAATHAPLTTIVYGEMWMLNCMLEPQ